MILQLSDGQLNAVKFYQFSQEWRQIMVEFIYVYKSFIYELQWFEHHSIWITY